MRVTPALVRLAAKARQPGSVGNLPALDPTRPQRAARAEAVFSWWGLGEVGRSKFLHSE
jgi:hypothetical protein